MEYQHEMTLKEASFCVIILILPFVIVGLFGKDYPLESSIFFLVSIPIVVIIIHVFYFKTTKNGEGD